MSDPILSSPLAPDSNGSISGTQNSQSYQIMLVLLLSLNFGIVFFDRNSLNFLMTFVQPDLNLTNTQVGWVAGIFSFAWALAAFGISRLSDLVGNRKLLLVISTLAFSACSFMTGLASTFAFLIGARILMGIAEGGIMPISHAIVASEVEPKYRGLAQGVAQNLGSNFFGSFVAPVVLVALAMKYGWQNAFFIAGIPGIVCALLIWFLIKEPEGQTKVASVPQAVRQSVDGSTAHWWDAYGEALKVRNIKACVVMGIALVAYLVICWAFMQLFLTKERGYTAEEASWLMATLGISATLGSFIIAGLSDAIGRRPVMIATPLIGIILPLGAIYYQGPYFGMVAIFFVGWSLNGIFPLFMATVPSESVSPAMAATAFGLCMGSCEILGGAAGPAIAGTLADAYGLEAPLWMMVALALIGAAAALSLKETAPRVLERRGAQ
jgi:MFS transporter, ACS family, hexuronate transporter